ncbi:MAG: UDP-N-acetylmuramoyl-tripeptide--D-alanyl-D-alanine ligase [bacterium]
MRDNKAVFTKEELAANLGDSAVQFISDNWSCKGVRSDSREIKADNLFVALNGETTDGHTYIQNAFKLGASAALVNQNWYKDVFLSLTKDEIIKFNSKLIIVKDTLKALGKLANIHRRRFNIPIIAIAGSNGKTTTKDLTASVLSQKFKVLTTYRNFNNQIGLPFMLFQLDTSHEIAVLEIGTNEPGEIAILSNILEPTHGLITNIGKEHLEKLIDLDGVEMEETFLFGFLHKTGGICFVNLDDERLSKYRIILEDEVSFSSTDKDAMIKAKISMNENLNPVLSFNAAQRQFEVQMKTTGFACGLNALAAASIGFHFGLTNDEIKSGLEAYIQEGGHGYARMIVENIGNFKILNDCYNANPDSMKMAFDSLKMISGTGRRLAVIGDMRELGEASFEEHKKILEKASEIADLIFIYGVEMNKAANAINNSSKILQFDTKEELIESLESKIEENDVILVKGSRGMAMEKIIIEIKNRNIN